MGWLMGDQWDDKWYTQQNQELLDMVTGPINPGSYFMPSDAVTEDRERIVRELKDAALYAIERPSGTRWYVDVEDAIAIARGEHDT